MTATPAPQTDLDEAWRDHRIAMDAVHEVTENADSALRAVLTTVKAYRLHKRRTVTPEEVDYGLVAEVIIEMEKLVQDW